MTLRVVAGRGSRALGEAVAARAGVSPASCDVDAFPDGEIRPRVALEEGDDVCVVQSTGPPVSENLLELALILDACRRSGARRLTAVVPYLCYARQDRRTRAGEALGSRVVAETIVAAGADRVVVVDPHTPTVEAIFGLPVEAVSAVDALAAAMADIGDGVVVAPDLGAVRLARRYGERLGLPVAVVQKHRLSGEDVRVDDVVGEVAGRTAIVVDDMISTGGTIDGAVDALLARGAAEEVVVAATHGLLVGPAAGRLARRSIRRLLVTDTVAVPDLAELPLEVHSVADALAGAVLRLHPGAGTGAGRAAPGGEGRLA